MYDTEIRQPAARPMRKIASIVSIGGIALWAVGCANPLFSAAPEPPVVAPQQCEDSVFQRASKQQSSYFEAEALRMQTDLEQAEAAMIAIESGNRSRQSRADAVSVLAEARISIEQARRNAPWRSHEVEAASAKLQEAESQLQAERLGTAIFFASRARRIANTLNDEAHSVSTNQGARFIRAQRVNLRAGPSTRHEILDVLPRQTPVLTERLEEPWWLVRTLTGQVGWVHAELLE